MTTEHWEQKKLDKLGFLGRGKSKHRPRNDPSLYGGDYPFIQTGAVKGTNLHITSFTETYNEKGLAQSKLWQPGTLLITIAANIAETAILGIPACFPDSIVGFIPDPKKADVRFIKYQIDYIKRQMQSIAPGAAQDNLSVEKLLTFDFLVPPLSTQAKITAVLSAYDDLIENNLHRIKLLEQAARDLYQEWFVHFRFPGHEQVELADNGIPTNWVRKTLDELAYQKREGVQPTEIEGNTPYVGLEHIPRKSLALQEWGMASDVVSTKLVFQENDILFGKIRPYFHKVVIAPIDGVTSSDTIVIVPREQKCLSLVLMCVSSDDFVAHATQTSQGTKMPRADWNVVKNYPILQPDDAVLGKFDTLLTAIICQIRNLALRNRILKQQRDLLLPRLISGELDVSEIPLPVKEEN